MASSRIARSRATTAGTVRTEARRLAKLLAAKNRRVVFAESCTGGLIAGTLAEIPGISSWLCGSAVVYQVETKAEWLSISRDVLKHPGPVSRVVAEAMALNVLEQTSQADFAASVTGHLGPNAPARQDGLFFTAVAIRGSDGTLKIHEVVRHVLGDDVPSGRTSLRVRRQRTAAAFVLHLVRRTLEVM